MKKKSCRYNRFVELTYSYGGHLQNYNGRDFFEDVIQISRCCLIKPNWYINSEEFVNLADIFAYIKNLGTPLSPTEKKNHSMCEGEKCIYSRYKKNICCNKWKFVKF